MSTSVQTILSMFPSGIRQVQAVDSGAATARDELPVGRRSTMRGTSLNTPLSLAQIRKLTRRRDDPPLRPTH